MKKFFILATVIFLITAPLLVSAANPCSKEAINPNQPGSSLPMCINQVYVWSLGVGALLAVLMAVLGSYAYMTAAGNAEQADKGKEYIWGAVIGLALLFTAYLLLRTINPDLVNFSGNSITCFSNPDAAGCPKTPSTSPGGGAW